MRAADELAVTALASEPRTRVIDPKPSKEPHACIDRNPGLQPGSLVAGIISNNGQEKYALPADTNQ